MIPAEHGLHPGKKLGKIEGFDNIIVRPHPQALHPIGHGGAGGDKDHRDLVFLEIVHQLEAVQPG